MTIPGGSRQSRVVANDHLRAGRISRSEVTTPRDCLAAFQQEFDYLCRTLRRLGAPSADVEDLVHDVFLVLHRRWADYDPSHPLRPWLFGIAFRVSSAHRRRWAREVPRALGDLEDRQPHPEQAFAAAQARAILLEALARVPFERRAVLVMRELDNVAMRDVASALSIPLFTAYSRLRKARKELEAAVQHIQQRVPR